MTKDDALRMADLMFRIITIFIMYCDHLDLSAYHDLGDCQDEIKDLYYHIKDGD